MAPAVQRGDYGRDPAAIYRESFAIIRREARLERLPPALGALAVRLIHACGMVDIVEDLAFGGEVARSGRGALAGGAAILCDSFMVAAGILRRRLPAENPVVRRPGRPSRPALAEPRRPNPSAAAAHVSG